MTDPATLTDANNSIRERIDQATHAAIARLMAGRVDEDEV